MPIKLLDPKTIARIAAGEVIERPASVVKELVENAIDAASTQIIIEVRGGGVGFIRVIDNGRGIPREEVDSAFVRHATSKLSRIEDLESLDTLGFRGEALASIAAVAEVELSTATDETQGGVLVQLKNSERAAHTSQARSRGTTVTVRNLFRNVPARLKFLKSTPTENSHIANIVTQYALAYPEINFTLLVEDRPTLQTGGRGQLLDVLAAVYGTDTAQKMLPVQSEPLYHDQPSEIKVSGLVSSPVVSRSSRDALSFFVNRRAVNNRNLAFAVEEAYTGLLMQGRHPVAVINIELPMSQVDVNVHPTKAEVKFADERAVFGAVQKAVRAALTGTAPIPHIAEKSTGYTGKSEPLPIQWNVPSSGIPQPSPYRKETAPFEVKRGQLPPLRLIGQIAACYIVAEGSEGMYVIDQHATHERVMYEKIKQAKAAQKVEVQGLLEPVNLELTPRQDAVMVECREALEEYGFSIDPFGERSYLIRTVPAVLAKSDFLNVIREFLDNPTGRDKERSEAIIKTLACHAAVKAGQILSHDEMTGLVRQLEEAIDPFHCPHGRPTLIQLSVRQLEKEFGRI